MLFKRDGLTALETEVFCLTTTPGETQTDMKIFPASPPLLLKLPEKTLRGKKGCWWLVPCLIMAISQAHFARMEVLLSHMRERTQHFLTRALFCGPNQNQLPRDLCHRHLTKHKERTQNRRGHDAFASFLRK